MGNLKRRTGLFAFTVSIFLLTSLLGSSVSIPANTAHAVLATVERVSDGEANSGDHRQAADAYPAAHIVSIREIEYLTRLRMSAQAGRRGPQSGRRLGVVAEELRRAGIRRDRVEIWEGRRWGEQRIYSIAWKN